MLPHFIPQDLTMQSYPGWALYPTQNIICSFSPGVNIHEKVPNLVELSPRQGKKVFEEAGNAGIK